MTGKEAITHVTVEERLHGYTLLSCRLETGRTHQIRIHLSEAGHPVCGDKVYCEDAERRGVPEHERRPRLALHATELGFEHPVDGRTPALDDAAAGGLGEVRPKAETLKNFTAEDAETRRGELIFSLRSLRPPR